MTAGWTWIVSIKYARIVADSYLRNMLWRSYAHYTNSSLREKKSLNQVGNGCLSYSHSKYCVATIPTKTSMFIAILLTKTSLKSVGTDTLKFFFASVSWINYAFIGTWWYYKIDPSIVQSNLTGKNSKYSLAFTN